MNDCEIPFHFLDPMDDTRRHATENADINLYEKDRLLLDEIRIFKVLAVSFKSF